MIRNSFTRRDFIACAAAASAAASVAPRLLAEPAKPRVGCQVNGFAARTGDFAELLSVLPTIKADGYAGFECNNHFVQSELDHPADARAKIHASGLEFIGMHTSMAEAEKNDLGRLTGGGAALGCHYIVMSATGLSKEGIFTPDALKDKVATLEKYGRICNSAGMKLRVSQPPTGIRQFQR